MSRLFRARHGFEHHHTHISNIASITSIKPARCNLERASFLFATFWLHF